MIFWSVEAASRRANPAPVVDDQQIEATTIDEVERQFNASLMASGHVHVADGGHAAFDFEMSRNRLALVFRKVLIDSEMVVDPPDARAPAEDVAVARWLLDYPLHWTASLCPRSAPLQEQRDYSCQPCDEGTEDRRRDREKTDLLENALVLRMLNLGKKV